MKKIRQEVRREANEYKRLDMIMNALDVESKEFTGKTMDEQLNIVKSFLTDVYGEDITITICDKVPFGVSEDNAVLAYNESCIKVEGGRFDHAIIFMTKAPIVMIRSYTNGYKEGGWYDMHFGLNRFALKVEEAK